MFKATVELQTAYVASLKYFVKQVLQQTLIERLRHNRTVVEVTHGDTLTWREVKQLICRDMKDLTPWSTLLEWLNAKRETNELCTSWMQRLHTFHWMVIRVVRCPPSLVEIPCVGALEPC